jgi:hypothetical protein
MNPVASLAACLLLANARTVEPAFQTKAPITPRPALSDVLEAAGNPTIPAAWGGIWDFSNTDYDCTTQEILGTDTDMDTLCTGDGFARGIETDCSGTVTDTAVDVTCSGQMEVSPGCNVAFTKTTIATRNGNSMSVTSTFATDYTPDDCAFTPDECVETQSTGTRIGPEPPTCSTSVDGIGWGRIKALYRSATK